MVCSDERACIGWTIGWTRFASSHNRLALKRPFERPNPIRLLDIIRIAQYLALTWQPACSRSYNVHRHEMSAARAGFLHRNGVSQPSEGDASQKLAIVECIETVLHDAETHGVNIHSATVISHLHCVVTWPVASTYHLCICPVLSRCSGQA